MPPLNINELGLVLFGTARAWRTKLDQRLRPLGLSQGKWRTLIHVSQGGNKLTQKEIAERMGIEEPTLAGLLDRLQEDGWIKRRESPNDRRCKIVHLQRRSKAVLDEIFNTAHGLRHELIEDVPPHERPPKRSIEKLIAMTTMARVNVATRQAVGHLEHRFGRRRVYVFGGIITFIVLLLLVRAFTG